MIETLLSRRLWAIFALLVICFYSLSAQGKYGGGTGEPNDPYLIYTAEQMNEIGLMVNSGDWDKHFKLMADIDLGVYTGTSFNIIGYWINSSDNNPFTGVFDGNDHTISNFTYDSNDRNYIGLFGYVYDPNSEIKNLGLIDPNVDAGTGSFVGSLVGRLREGTITGCYVEGGIVSGDRIVGGLAGRNRGTITDCYSTASASGGERVGGLVGWDIDGTTANCYATGQVTGTGSGVGGLVGENSGTITDSYATGVVDGNTIVGGLVGSASGRIANCYSIGTVIGTSDVGGLVGFNSGAVVSSYWDMDTSGQTSSAAGIGKTTAQMQTAATYVSWGCGAVWTIDEGVDYPHLVWENSPGILLTDLPVYVGGSGEPNDPYLIATAGQLNAIGQTVCHWDKHFVLTADIDLSQYTGTEFNIIPYFTGVFDGNGHTISNFTYDSNGINNVGLFGYVDDPNAEIRNLGLIDPNVDAGIGEFVGALIGQLNNGTISGCYVEGDIVSISGDTVGGLCGYNYGTITNCYAQGGDVSGDQDGGGLVGQNRGTITNCYATGSVTGSGSNVGGLAGFNGGTITNCYATGSVTGSDYCVGGLVGHNNGTIFNCDSSGSVTGAGSGTGGLCGANSSNGTISNCYSTADVNGVDRVGGLVGSNTATSSMVSVGTIINCYATGSVSGTTDVGGLAGWNIGTVTNCSSTGSVSGNSGHNTIGGLVGYNRGTITNCYSTGDINGAALVGGLVGDNSGSVLNCFWDTETQTHGITNSIGNNSGTVTNVAGLPTAQMQTRSTFTNAGWDFVNERGNGTTESWMMPTGGGYPVLSNFHIDIPIPLSGSGTTTNPYLIGGANELGMVNWYPADCCFKLTRDIDLSGIHWSMAVIPVLDGCFDGNDHRVLNMQISGTACLGLFGYLRGNSQVRDLGFEGGSVNGTGDCVGGLVGLNDHGSVSNCYSTGSVTSGAGSSTLGGLVGMNNSGTITNCYATGSVTGDDNTGGLVGYNWKGTISNSYSNGSVAGDYYVGGLVGRNNRGTITNCYATGSVTGPGNNVGGLVGRNVRGIISDCYSTGSVSGTTYVGGLAGYDSSGSYIACFWDSDVNPGVNGIGNTTDPNVMGKTTAQMQTQGTFTDYSWDFVGETINGPNDIWRLCEDLVHYPLLAWEFPLGDFLCPDGVDFFDYSFFALHWLEGNCGASNDCEGTDLDQSGVIGSNDLGILADNWLEGVKPPIPPPPGCIAHWKFDDSPGSSIAIDSAGTNNGTLNGDPNWTTGIIDGALDFDGDGDYVAVDAIDPLAGDNFTFMAWVRLSESAGLYNPVLTQHDPNDDGCYFYIAHDKPTFYIVNNPGSVQAISHETINADQWYHVAVTNDGSALKMYVNSVQKDSVSSSGFSGVDYNAYIGCEIDAPFYYNGLIDEVRIYNRALTEEEITYLAD